MRMAGQAEVVGQDLAVIGVDAMLDDRARPGGRALAAQVGNALVGDHDLDGVFAVVQMADQRDDGANLAVLGRRGAGEDGEESVAGEVP